MLLLTCLVAPLLLQDAATPDPRVAVSDAYHAAYGAHDTGLMGVVWNEHPTLVLGTFDADLEAGLSAWEKQGEGHEAKTKEHFARAVWAAEIASTALNQPIFGDYANSFVNWSPAERKSFRRGQAAYGEARQALKKGEHDASLKLAVECRDLAIALGDWWGTAMGLGGEGAALAKLGRNAEAATAYSRARLLNHQLGLRGSEYRALHGLASSTIAAGHFGRGIRAANDGLGMARSYKDAKGVHALLTLRATAEEALGDTAALKATQLELAETGQ